MFSEITGYENISFMYVSLEFIEFMQRYITYGLNPFNFKWNGKIRFSYIYLKDVSCLIPVFSKLENTNETQYAIVIYHLKDRDECYSWFVKKYLKEVLALIKMKSNENQRVEKFPDLHL